MQVFPIKIDTRPSATDAGCYFEAVYTIEADVEPETPAFFTEKKPRRRGQRKAHGWQDY